ncbi:MAG: hypothetical protein ABIR06_00335 [Cyclobacteriaceae bacterium]
MQTEVSTQIDQEIEKYKTAHNGNKPLYMIMNTDEADALTESLKTEQGQSQEIIITSYKDIKIVRNNLMEKGDYVLSNELPETGS